MRTPEQIEELLDKLENLLGTYDEAQDKYDRGQWSDKYGERFGKYADKLKLLNGDDFDIVAASYDEHKNDYSDLSDDEYCDALEENIKKVLARVWPDASDEQIEEVAEDIKDAAEESSDEESSEEEKIEEETPSDEDLKRTTGPWGNPCESGGRDGKCGLPGRGKKVTSDEKAKEEPKAEEEAIEEAVEATPSKVDDIVAEVATAKPEDVEPGETTEEDPDKDLKEYAAKHRNDRLY